MKTNLIQSYIQGTPLIQQYNSRKAEDNFDVHKELATRTFIKPLPSNGHLVQNTIFDVPSEIYNDIKYNFKALKHSINGEANDHELGYLNDMGMKFGGLAIASYLFARKSTPLTKVMEFVGLGSFFAAMDIWPKLALQLPAYLIHGVDVRQKYVDNYGRKKLFYQDHQFIPWNLYSDEEINKIGDKMGVPKDMKNRRDFIQEKMRKIALQNNTLWMLTSGFATPIMSALICNALEKPITNYQREKQIKKADELLKNFPQEIKKYSFDKNAEKLNLLLDNNVSKNLTPETVNDIVKTMTEGLDAVTACAVEKDIKNILPSMEVFNVNSEAAVKIQNLFIKNFAPLNLSSEISARIIPDINAIENTFNEQGLLTDGVKDFSEHIKAVQSLLERNIQKFTEENPNNPLNNKLTLFRKKLIHSVIHGDDSALKITLKSKHSAVLSEDIKLKLKDTLKIINDLKSKNIVLDQYAYIKYAQAPETVLADDWNSISRNLLKPLGITEKEIKDTRYDRKLVAKLLRDKFDAIVSSDSKYFEVINSIQKELSKLPQIRIFEGEGEQEIGDGAFKEKVVSTFKEASESLKKYGMNSTAEALAGFDEQGTTSLKHIYLKFVDDRILGVKSSFYRILNTLDVYRRIAKVENVDFVLNSTMPREVKEELVELCKNLLISAHASDYATKFYSRRNVELNPQNKAPDFYSQIETHEGKVVNRYLGTHKPEELAELSNDRKFFEAAMKLMYDGELHPDTMNGIKDSVFKQDFLNYRKEVLKYLGGDKYFAKPNHLVNGEVHPSSSLLRMLLLGSAPDEMISKLCRQRYNSTKWLKIFGTLGASLLGVTVLAQFFTGRMPKSSKEGR